VDWSGQCAVLIPCLNEAATIGTVVAQARLHLSTVVVVNDGSCDRTEELAALNGATVLRHDRSRGKGAALRTGLNWLHEQNFPWTLMMDGDGQHLADDITHFLSRAETTDAALIIGNRMLNSASMPWLRRRVNQWMSNRLSAVAGKTLPDSQCGFRLLRLSIWPSLELRTNHFEFESELLIASLASGHRVEFVPVRAIYGRESSKIRPIPDTWRWLKWWISLRTSRAGPNRVKRNQRPENEVNGLPSTIASQNEQEDSDHRRHTRSWISDGP